MVTVAQAAVAPGSQSQRIEVDEAEKVSVLLVDDRPEISMAMVAFLRSPALDLICAESGQAALEALDHHDFALILLDVEMPGMDGFETARRIREKPERSHLPIIFVTASLDYRNFVFEGYATGAVDVVFKPFEPVILVSKVNAFVNLYRHERKLLKAIRSQLETKDRFFRHVSHELRTPLNAVCRFLEIVESGMAGELNEEQEEYLGISLRNAHSLNELISDLLDLVRTQNDKMTMLPQCISLRDIIDELLPPLEASANSKQIEISIHLGDALPFAWADPARIRQVILNLAENALKFAPRQSVLSLSVNETAPQSGVLQLDVTDQGPGINPDRLTAIFEPLHQDEMAAAETSRKGLGLGLSICKELVTQHGGKIWVDSRGRNGSTFSFTLQCFQPSLCLPLILKNDTCFEGNTSLIIFSINADSACTEGKSASQLYTRYRELLERCAGGQATDAILPGSLLADGAVHAVSMILTIDDEASIRTLTRRCKEEFAANNMPSQVTVTDVSGLQIADVFQLHAKPSALHTS